MKKVDRLDWTAGFAFNAYGTSVGIRTNDKEALGEIKALLPPGSSETTEPVVDTLFSLRVGPETRRKGVRNYHLLYLNAAQQARTMVLEQALDVLENLVTIIVAYGADSKYLFVHAGVVGWKDTAVVIPGTSFSGKTTLVSELIKTGATYYSDDMAIFDSNGYVHPFAVSLSVRSKDGNKRLTAEHFGSKVGNRPLPVGLVLVTKYEQGAVWQPEELTPAETMMALLDNTVAARKDPKTALPILQQVAMSALALKSNRGDAQTTVAQLKNRLQVAASTSSQFVTV